MIKLFTNEDNQEVGSGGRSYHRSVEFIYPVLSTTSSAAVYINHNLGTRCIRMSMIGKYSVDGGHYIPYMYFRDDWTAARWYGWFYGATDENTAWINFRRWHGSGTLTCIVDIWGEEEHPAI